MHTITKTILKGILWCIVGVLVSTSTVFAVKTAQEFVLSNKYDNLSSIYFRKSLDEDSEDYDSNIKSIDYLIYSNDSQIKSLNHEQKMVKNVLYIAITSFVAMIVWCIKKAISDERYNKL